MLAGGCSLWRSNNVKATTPSWASIKGSPGSEVSAIAVAPGNSDIIWVGHNNGNIYRTSNGTAATPTWTQVDGTLPNRYITRLTVDWTDHNKVYVTMGGYSTPNVYKTVDNGASWSSIGAGLPAVPVRSLLVHKYRPDWLYIGTEVGIFASMDGGATWKVPHDGPTNTSVDELQWMNSAILAATHGRGVCKAEADTCRTLNITVTPSSSGTVKASPAPNCVTDPTKYSRGTRVVLRATPAPGKSFLGWSGSVTGTPASRAVMMHVDRSVTGTFSP
jgi:photosystem II stability/assembly factor-like uncharacterized protein